MTDPEHLDRVAQFRVALEAELDDEIVVRQHILHGSPFAIDSTALFRVKQHVADKYSVDANAEVYLVGSARLGFSIAPTKRYLPFGDRSDIDLAIVSHDLYQRIWWEVHAFKLEGGLWPNQRKFESYAAWGWIRPDLLPASPVFELANEWFEFFRDVQSSRLAGAYKVSAALYHDMSFLIRNQARAVAACRGAEED